MVGDDEDLEFLPSDDVDEVDQAGPEDEAVHVHDADESRELLTVEDEGFDAESLDDDEVEGLEVEAGDGDAVAEAEPGVAGGEGHGEHEEDLQEILHRHYGLVGEQPGEDLAAGDRGRQPAAPDEFVCRTCFLRRPTSQLADPALGICIDCAAAGAVPGG